MMETLIKEINKNCHNVDIDKVTQAYELAEKAHEGQMRVSGEPYITHPIEVATILAGLGMDTDTIVAGLLHDVIEDTECTYDEMKGIFGEEITNLVDGVTKLGKITYKTKEEQQADNVRKMLLAMAKDIRVIIIKLADRLHNLRTLKYMAKEKRKVKAKETLEIYAPLAHRLGMSKIKWELEDLSFRYLHEEEYYDLVSKIAEKRVEREQYIASIVEDLGSNLEDAGIDADIDGRPKHFYSIYRKMVKKNKNIEQIFDLTAIRVLANSVKDCYGVLGIVHTIYKPIPGRFKDYIAMPKPNMYQSLHTTVIGPQGKTFEIQIRTFEMHKVAEYGIAAHWKYKEGAEETKEMNFETKLAWLRDMLEWQKETSDAEEFMEGFKIDLFSDEVFVFTPKGVVINLPSGSTPIDFAYRIHTDIGNKCIGAKVNGKIVALDCKLKTGEIVEIITSRVANGPKRDWVSIAKSNQAKSKIRQWFKRAKREENISYGRELLEKEFKKSKVAFTFVNKAVQNEKIQKKYNVHSTDELYGNVGTGIINAHSFVEKVKEELGLNVIEKITKETEDKQVEEQLNKGNKNVPKEKDYGVTVKGLNNIMVRFARCCNPVPGDEVLGYITKGRGVSIHRKDCSNLKALIAEDPEKVLEASFGEDKKSAYIAEVQIKADDRLGILSDLMTIINEAGLMLTSLNANSAKGNVAIVNLKVKIKSIDQLKEIIKKIRHISGVIDVYRMNS
ncbi:bifunctional (p)ppGpp synthetase/guanosine-3',5'-bis(diphosphate) 3'-pyrophosphohydrolase [uncultured Clostridium sp.]|uniref:RelA/SpoT family protein n=1 Tax=uncultured Clostridium sp. TaxID=59620 RepID=UPI002602267C|nr:bifunctional (p)ppGpp synthetase/guanosine-3',5'-bis(diphosphate) 3'-pyrophosphohydrolase [uncultured Clostridium sp.]